MRQVGYYCGASRDNFEGKYVLQQVSELRGKLSFNWSSEYHYELSPPKKECY